MKETNMTQQRRTIPTPGKQHLQSNATGSVQFYNTNTMRIEKGSYQLVIAPPLMEGGNYQRTLGWHWGCHPSGRAPLPCLAFWPGNDTCPICAAIEKINQEVGDTLSEEQSRLLGGKRASTKAYVNAFNRSDVKHKGVPLKDAFRVWELAMKAIRPLVDQLQLDINSLHPERAVILDVKKIDKTPSGFPDYPAHIVQDNDEVDQNTGEYAALRIPWITYPDKPGVANLDAIYDALDALPNLETYFPYPDETCIQELHRGANNILGQFLGHIPSPGSMSLPGNRPTTPPPVSRPVASAPAEAPVTQPETSSAPPQPPTNQGANAQLPPEVDGAKYPCYGGNMPHRETGKRGFDAMLRKCLTCSHQAPCQATYQEGGN